MTGCVLARLLQLKGEEDVVLLEANEEPGGLCRTKQIGSHVLDIGGGHFLCTKYQEVYDFIFSHIPEKEFHRFERVSKVQVEGEIIDYPVEHNLWQLSEQLGKTYVDSCLHAGEIQGRPQPQHFEEWIRWKLGDRIADHYMLPYNRKIWGVEPDEMDIDWLSKLPRVDTDSILESWKNRHSDRARMPSHAYFYYPREGGFQRIFDAVSEKVANKIWLSKPVRKMEFQGDRWHINDEIHADVVVNTAPWRRIHSTVVNAPDLGDSITKLRESSLVVSLYEESYSHDWHWLYLASESIPHHREFFIHNFAPHSAPNGLYRETNLQRWKPGHGEQFSWINDAAYPIPLRGHSAAIQRLLEAYRSMKLFGVGRWGQHAYFNSDVCIREAMLFVNNL